MGAKKCTLKGTSENGCMKGSIAKPGLWPNQITYKLEHIMQNIPFTTTILYKTYLTENWAEMYKIFWSNCNNLLISLWKRHLRAEYYVYRRETECCKYVNSPEYIYRLNALPITAKVTTKLRLLFLTLKIIPGENKEGITKKSTDNGGKTKQEKWQTSGGP